MRRFSRFSKLLPNGEDEPGRRFFKLTVYLSIGIILIMIFASLITFFLTIEGEEQTLVPDVQGMELENAMIELQNKGLLGYVQLRVSPNPSDKGTVLNQEPDAGALVKVGRQIDLRAGYRRSRALYRNEPLRSRTPTPKHVHHLRCHPQSEKAGNGSL